MLTSTSVSSPASSASSRPTVPCPAITYSSSNGCTAVSPAARSSAASANAPGMSSVTRTVAPAAVATSRAWSGADAGITMVALIPISAAITATAMPWLPPLTATTPAPRSAVPRASSRLAAPRTVNDPVRCNTSSLAVTGTPSRSARPGAGTVGVRRTYGAIRRAAASICAYPIMPGTPSPPAATGQAMSRPGSGRLPALLR